MFEQLLEFRTEMESSLTWRLDEYRILKKIIKDENRISVIKVLIVMLYAHLEGFYKDCMECYIKLINETGMDLKKFNESLITASLHKQFSSFEDVNRKCRELTTVPPAEDYLHRFHRRKELTKLFNTEYLNRNVRIKENIINTKSNLTYAVWQENLYLLGLDKDYFSHYHKNIDKLVRLRNNIAHGSQRDPIDANEFDKLESNIIELMESLILYLYDYCYYEKYKSEI